MGEQRDNSHGPPAQRSALSAAATGYCRSIGVARRARATEQPGCGAAHGNLRVAAAVVMMTGLDTDSGMDLQKAQDDGARASENLVAALDAAVPLTGPTNEGHGR